MEIWNDAGDTQYFSTVSSPVGNDWNFSGGTSIPVTTSSASFRVRFTAKSHAALAAGTYAVTGTVTSYTCTNAQAGTDTDSATITVDNSPPADATWGMITPGDTQIELNWSNPGDADFNKVVILRRAGSAVGDAPTDGTEYNVNDPIGSSTVRYVGSLQTFTDTGLSNGTDYYYKIFAYDTYINYASGTGTGPHTPDVVTTLGDGTDPGNSTVAPGSADQYVDQFTFVTSSGSDSVTALIVTTANTAAIASMEIWNDAGDTQYFSTVSSPVGNDWSFSGGTSIPVTTSSASFRVRFTAKSHAALAAGTYAVTCTVTSYTCTNAQAGTDTDSATITVDNSPPADASWGTIIPGDTQIELNWSNPGDADFNKVLILRRAGSAVGDAPTDGTEYNVNDTIGSSTVRYVGSLGDFTDTGLTNGTDYYYKIFAYDTYINYASGASTGPHTPTMAINYRSIGTNSGILYNTGNASINSGSTVVTFGGGASLPEPTAVGAVGQGDKLIIGSETFFILSRVDDTHVTVQTAAASTHTDEAYEIRRAYNDFQSWEDPCGATPCLPTSSGGRGGNLAGEDRMEVGVAYKDDVFTPTATTTIDGSTTNATYYMKLTVAPGQRHNGRAGTGVVVDGSNIPALGSHLFHVRDEYFRMEWLEIRNYPGDAANGQPINLSEGNAGNNLLSKLIIHDFTSYGPRGAINVYENATIRNCIFYNGDKAIRTYQNYGSSPVLTLENVTIYNMSGIGVDHQAGKLIVKNTISVGSGRFGQ
jgi:hypothetical protein